MLKLNVGDTLLNGADVLAVEGSIVLAFFRDQYVTWQVTEEQDGLFAAFWGSYYGHSANDAHEGFKARCAQ